MAVKFFGQFLLEKQMVGSADLLKAIELQETTNLKFGATALSMGLLKIEQFEQVHDAQRHEDLKFGDMAVKLGLLSEEQVSQVLIKQKNNHLYIGEALVKIGALNQEALRKCLSEFKEDQSAYVVDRIRIPAGVPSSPVWELIADMTFKMLTRVVGLECRPDRARVVEALDPADHVVSMGFKGNVSGKYVLCVSSALRLAMARAILKEDDVSGESEEVLDDTVMEFANIVCGNIAAKAAQMGQDFDIDPPMVLDSSQSLQVGTDRCGLVFPLLSSDGEKLALGILIDKD